jgi:hypothetical protein
MPGAIAEVPNIASTESEYLKSDLVAFFNEDNEVE